MEHDSQTVPYVLALLPAPPSPAVRQLKDAYDRALSRVFADVSSQIRGTSNIAKIDIALVIPQLLSAQYQPRSKAFASLQHLLATFYTFVGTVSASDNVELDGPGGVDVRVFFVDDQDCSEVQQQRLHGPVTNLKTLAISQRAWDRAYVLDTISGERLASRFSEYGASVSYSKLPGGIASISPEGVLVAEEGRSTKHYSVIVGGTFDHLHLGHKLLLTATALALDPFNNEGNRSLTVGITGDEMLVNKKFAEYLESWEDRWQNTASFLKAIVDFNPPENQVSSIQRTENPGPNGKRVSIKVVPDLYIHLVQIADPYGPTITEENLSALIVSAETRSGGQAVNTERNKKGWASLEVFEVDVLQTGEAEEVASASASSFESKISSTDIRQRRMKSAKGHL
ncbi:pantetheine-phosphate adenylyltransferase family protein [Talaromyces proteolyticus]|uniref:Pantetheine-phosphate adenylyltransferase family protein n=1 Tax=Talaromyces proteolyticus TaxID=1131652 RepID=A0AAD4KY53_9EURO|nr:pantetheine-phosphate adenylyltransferase family protein [Talaromyces proteolyticus]KAH8700181.1 pantetheine-phosphate adenylyltransferase family protein [Talaromyces proteolyticus]